MSTTTAPMSAGYRPGGELRLTRRGRLVVLALALAMLFLCGLVWAAGSVASGDKSGPPPRDAVTVGTGDTLWQIAAARTESGDVQAMVDQIMAINHLSSPAVEAGDVVLVPAG